MADKKTYIVQYKMPLGLENPKINIPTPNTPVEFDLTEGDVALLRRLVPDIKCVPANKAEEKEAEVEEEVPETEESEEETSEEEETTSEDEEEVAEDKATDEGAESNGEDAPTEDEEAEEETEAESAGTELPEDFPGRDKLIEAGLDTIEKVTEFKIENDLTELDGIGSATADKISDQLVK